MRVLIALALLTAVGRVSAQEPLTPPDTVAPAPAGGVRLGLFGFGGAVGVDLDGDADVVLGYALDIGDFFTPQIRLRPSVAVGVRSGGHGYVGNIELLYRFTPDTSIAIPYVGLGLGVQGRDGCSADPSCPSLWAQFALGFELPLRDTFNWMLEYHGEDALRRHRLFVGFVTRRGS